MKPYVIIANVQGDALKRMTDYMYSSDEYPGVAPIIDNQVWMVVSTCNAHKIREDLSKLIDSNNVLMVVELGMDFSAQRISGGLRAWVQETRQKILGLDSDIRD